MRSTCVASKYGGSGHMYPGRWSVAAPTVLVVVLVVRSPQQTFYRSEESVSVLLQEARRLSRIEVAEGADELPLHGRLSILRQQQHLDLLGGTAHENEREALHDAPPVCTKRGRRHGD